MSAVERNWEQLSTFECNWVKLSAVEYNWEQLSTIECSWVQLSAVECNQVQTSEIECSWVILSVFTRVKRTWVQKSAAISNWVHLNVLYTHFWTKENWEQNFAFHYFCHNFTCFKTPPDILMLSNFPCYVSSNFSILLVVVFTFIFLESWNYAEKRKP